MPAQDNENLVRSYYQAFNDRDINRGASYIADDFEWEIVPFGTTLRGPEGYRRFMSVWETATPDGKIQLNRVIPVGDWVVTEFTFTGTQTGPLVTPAGEIPSTGQTIELKPCELLQVKDGKLVHGRVYFDLGGLMRQLEWTPQPVIEQPTESQENTWLHP